MNLSLYEIFSIKAHELFSKHPNDKDYYKALRKEIDHIVWLNSLNITQGDLKCRSFLQ